MRTLTESEQKKLQLLTENSVSLALIQPTETALNKSIMDATGPVRNYLKAKGFHDYEEQGQGPASKVMIEGYIYEEYELHRTRASLYRPSTKKGDPRIWFRGLTKYASPNDIVAIICFNEIIHVLNLTKLPIEELIKGVLLNPLKELVNEIRTIENEVAVELLSFLRELGARGPIPSLVDADTSVGRTLETALGIQINSSKEPDYKGIELKSFRARKGSKAPRKSLFAQVPNWNLSKFKSSSEILDAFGYQREKDFKLYCTVSALTSNSQGLSLRLDSEINHLIEKSDAPKIGDFVVWHMDTLHSRLLQKHRETFWVKAKSIRIEGKEHFHYQEVEHTQKPITSQFDILLEQGIITLDHSIKRNSGGRGEEKGPFFKIKSDCLNLLFPPSEIYSLIS